MSELEIPVRAVNVAARVAFQSLSLDDGLKAAAPIIVAAELLGYVAALREMGPLAEGTVVAPQFVIDTIAGDLSRRADELDPEGAVR